MNAGTTLTMDCFSSDGDCVPMVVSLMIGASMITAIGSRIGTAMVFVVEILSILGSAVVRRRRKRLPEESSSSATVETGSAIVGSATMASSGCGMTGSGSSRAGIAMSRLGVLSTPRRFCWIRRSYSTLSMPAFRIRLIVVLLTPNCSARLMAVSPDSRYRPTIIFFSPSFSLLALTGSLLENLQRF